METKQRGLTGANRPIHLKENLRVDEACEILDVGRTTLYMLLRDRTIPSFLVKGSRRIRRSDLEKYVEQQIREER